MAQLQVLAAHYHQQDLAIGGVGTPGSQPHGGVGARRPHQRGLGPNGPLVWALMGPLVWALMGPPGLGPNGLPWSGPQWAPWSGPVWALWARMGPPGLGPEELPGLGPDGPSGL
jgi:hypothetical protein